MRRINELTVGFKKELSNIELRGIEGVINDLSTSEDRYNFSVLEGLSHEHYGLAYTSSSSYAMYNVTERIFFDTMGEDEISHFSITDNDMLIMVVDNEGGYSTYYEIECTDFN